MIMNINTIVNVNRNILVRSIGVGMWLANLKIEERN